ncbi:MAG: protein kinase, partial [Gemmatimonadetes bacterium]|nr:protein kinase [Gemmatimonadota bacterium]
AINRAHEKITQQGTITGTPAYMSPEQARDRAFDGRSDVYSLACVLYEAISGVPPFVGETPQEQLSQRITKTPPPLHEFRHDVPAPIAVVIAKALSISPDDRYADARAFSAALSAAIGHSGETLTARTGRRPQSRNPWLWAAGLALVLTGGAVTMPAVREKLELLTARVDSTQFAVVPFQYVGAPRPAADAEPAADGVYAALKRWEGLRLASDVRVHDELRALRGDTLSLDDVARVARSVRAGRVVWGRVHTSRESVTVRAVLYDALTGESLREITRVVPAGRTAAAQVDYGALVVDLLRAPRVAAISSQADRGTSSYVAWQAFERGAIALSRWDVDVAIAAFDSAVAADPSYPQANLWIAQIKAWRRAPAKEWTTAFIAADRGRDRLDAREQLFADALGAVSKDDFPSACRSYDTLRQRDTLDAVAWLGLAFCQGNDRAVVRSASSPSGFAFRGSYEAAWRAVNRAFELAPESFDALPSDFLRRIAQVEYNRRRLGDGPDGQFFAAPALARDTVEFVPYPASTIAAAGSPETYDAALRFNRDRMLTLLESLSQRLPGSAVVFEAMTNLLEARDEIIGTPNGRYSALSALERARALSTDPDQRLRLAAADVRLHLKLADFARAAATADSVLSAGGGAQDGHAAQFAALAAFAGRTGLATRYLRESGPRDVRQTSDAVPAANDAATALLMRAALGVCDDSIRALPTSIVRTLDSYVGPAQRQQTADRLLERPVSLAVPCTGPAATLAIANPVSALVRMQQVAARGDRAGVTRMLDSIAVTRRVTRPGAISLDYIIQEAWLADFAGDPRRAAAMLDLTLTALPTLSSFTLTEPVMAASVGRAMAYRAELAARLGDPSSAALWASRVLTLWAHADANLELTMVRMRRLAARQSPS